MRTMEHGRGSGDFVKTTSQGLDGRDGKTRLPARATSPFVPPDQFKNLVRVHHEGKSYDDP